MSVNKCLNEVKILNEMSPHENVLLLIGAFLDDDRGINMIFPLAIGTFKTFNLDTEQKVKCDRVLYSALLGVQNGLKHLESCKVIHSDIKPDNILVFDNNVCKIGDFGEAKIADVSGYVTGFSGNVEYHNLARLDPTTYGKQGYSFSADRWSLGVIILKAIIHNEYNKVLFGTTAAAIVGNIKTFDIRTHSPHIVDNPYVKTFINLANTLCEGITITLEKDTTAQKTQHRDPLYLAPFSQRPLYLSLSSMRKRPTMVAVKKKP